MTIHYTGSVIMKMRNSAKKNGVHTVGVVVIDEQDRLQMYPRVSYQVRVLQEAANLGIDVFFLELNPWVGSETTSTIDELLNAAPNGTRITKATMNCFSEGAFTNAVAGKNTLVVMGKWQESCIKNTIHMDDETHVQSAAQRNIRVLTSGKLIQKKGNDPTQPIWAINEPLIDFYKYVGTRSYATIKSL